MMKKIILGDCLVEMGKMSADCVDSIVTDPPYGLSFMGKNWDHGIPGVPFWTEALRVAKPGAFLLAFGGTRTFHRLTCAIEDAGWEIRDCIMWVYGSGFPKSHNLNGEHKGWGTALKPAWEPIIVARKPLCGTVAENVQKYGTGSMNIDGCRVDTFVAGEMEKLKARAESPRQDFTGGRLHSCADYTPKIIESGMSSLGRWPANVIHDGSEEVLDRFPNTVGACAPVMRGQDGSSNGIYGDFAQKGDDGASFRNDNGSASRFFYCAKASKSDRDEGLDGFEERKSREYRTGNIHNQHGGRVPDKISRNFHPTVKPTNLMRYLCRLVTPVGGTVLDPFAGSGSTGKAAIMEGFKTILIEQNPEYVKISEARTNITPGFLNLA